MNWKDLLGDIIAVLSLGLTLYLLLHVTLIY